jgi:hypothetical protein
MFHVYKSTPFEVERVMSLYISVTLKKCRITWVIIVKASFRIIYAYI